MLLEIVHYKFLLVTSIKTFDIHVSRSPLLVEVTTIEIEATILNRELGTLTRNKRETHRIPTYRTVGKCGTNTYETCLVKMQLWP